MAEILRRRKALSVDPLGASQSLGATLAFLGIHRAMPMLHGALGCTAFGKVFFVRHFREPIPLQTSAMDQVSAVMGADDNVLTGLKAIAGKSNPALIGLATTGLSETQGSDIQRLVREFREQNPEYRDTAVVAVNTPDFNGCLESGYATAVAGLLEQLVPESGVAGTGPGQRPRQVNVLAGSSLTPGDAEAMKDLLESFGLRPLLIPDLADSLDGHLTDEDFSPLTVGGTPLGEFATLGDAIATLVVGPSLYRAADLLKARTGVPDHRFAHLMGLEAVDRLMLVLSELSGRPVPARQNRERARLQDAMVDSHFMIGQTRLALALEPDLLLAFSQFLAGMGAETVAAVTPARGPALAQATVDTVQLGDLEDLRRLAREADAQLLIGSSHALPSARQLGVPLLRAGFPQYDLLGGYQRTWIGYRGARDCLFQLANLLLHEGHQEIPVYRSPYAQKSDEVRHAPATTSATGH